MKIDKTAGEADVTTRNSGGWREKAPTLRECTITFKMLFLAGNANVSAIRGAYLNGSQVRLAALTDEKSSDGTMPDVGSEGVLGDFPITRLTMEVYTHLEQGEKSATINCLPGLGK